MARNARAMMTDETPEAPSSVLRATNRDMLFLTLHQMLQSIFILVRLGGSPAIVGGRPEVVRGMD